MSYKQQVSHYKMDKKSCSAAFLDTNLQVIRGSQLSSESSDYLVLDLIGQGAFAKVAKCVKSATNETVAVRITKKCSSSEAEEEDAILQKLKVFDPDTWHFVRWDSSFVYKVHLCQEFELLDMNLKEFVNMRPTSSLPLRDIRPILHQVATALQFLKSLGIAHSDLKPENIMLVDHVRKPLKIKLIDFGSACDASKAEQGSCIQHRWYRAPEILLGLPCNEAIDMWSLGCIAAELFLGFPLYPGSCDYEMIWIITQTQGQLPGYFLSGGLKTSQFYRKAWPNIWKLMTPHEYGRIPWIDCMFGSLDDLKKVQQKPDRRMSEADTVRDKADLENFVELVKQMLQLDPTQRITPGQVLQHPLVTTSHLIDFCCPQSMSSDEPTRQPPSENPLSKRSSFGTQSQQHLLSLSDKDKSRLAHIKPLEKRKRAYAEISQSNRIPDSTSPLQKRRKICVGRLLMKRSYSEITKNSKRIPGTSSPKRTRRKIWVGRPLIKRPYCEINKGSKIIPKISSPQRMIIDSEEKDIEPPSSSKKAPSTVVHVTFQRKDKKETKGNNRMPEISSPERKILDSEEKDTEIPSSSNKAPSTVIHVTFQRKEEDKNKTKAVTKIWIIGSSYIRRGEEAAYENFGENFGLNAKVEWFGKGGMRWSGVLPRFYTELSNTQSAPDILVVHAGGNDLGMMPAKKLASIMEQELTQLNAEFPSMTIAYSCINERQVWRNGPPWRVDVDRKTVNKCMRRAVCNFSGEVIEHPILRYFERKIFLADGVHFTKKGNCIFVTSIQCVLMKILQKRLQRNYY